MTTTSTVTTEGGRGRDDDVKQTEIPTTDPRSRNAERSSTGVDPALLPAPAGPPPPSPSPSPDAVAKADAGGVADTGGEMPTLNADGGRKRPLHLPLAANGDDVGAPDGAEAEAEAAAPSQDDGPNSKRARVAAASRPAEHHRVDLGVGDGAGRPVRLEVLWDVVTTSPPSPDDDGGSDGGGAPPPSSPDAPSKSKDGGEGEGDLETTRTAWWGATLLPPPPPSSGGPVETHTFEADDDADDDSDPVTVPVRVLEYDPNPAMGYPDRTTNRVAFLSDRLVYDVGEGAACHFRIEGSDWEPGEDEDDPTGEGEAPTGGDDGGEGGHVLAEVSREGMMAVIESILGGLLANKLASQFSALSAARRAWVAERVATAKERFVDSMMREYERRGSGGGAGGGGGGAGKGDFVITPDHVRRCMEEVGRELASSSS